MNFKPFAVLLLIVSLVSVPAGAQIRSQTGVSSEPGDLSPEERQALEKKAMALLDELVSDGMGLRLAENRIHILIFAAEVLGKRDADRARGHVREAINQYLALGALPAEKNPRYLVSVRTRQVLRGRLILTAAQLDPALALEFMRTSRSSVPAEKQPANESNFKSPMPEDERQLEMQLAAQIAESDPKLALQLAEEVLKQDSDYQVVDIWRRLQRKDPKVAAGLAKDIVTKLKSSDLMKNYSATAIINEMIIDLRRIVRGQKTANSESSQSSESAVSIQEYEQTFRSLLEMIVTTALKVTATNLMDVTDQGQARNMLSQAQSLLPDIEKYLPARASQLRAKLGQFDNAYYHPPTMAGGYEELETKSATELVAMAEGAKGETQDVLYGQAMMKALAEDRIDLAKQISSQHLKGSYDFVNSEIDRLEREKALREGKVEEARRALEDIPSTTERALSLTRMAENVKDPKTQKQLLDEARSLLGDRLETRSQVEAQISLAASFLQLDAEYSFTQLEAAIEKLNSVLSASILLTKFTQEAQIEDEELPLSQSGIPDWFMGGFESKVLTFARKDFARTQAAIAKWQPGQTRLIINIILITSILAGDNSELRQQYFSGDRER